MRKAGKIQCFQLSFDLEAFPKYAVDIFLKKDYIVCELFNKFSVLGSKSIRR